MGLKDLLEMLTIDLIAEFLGLLFFIAMLTGFLLDGGAAVLIEAWAKSVCG